MLARMAKTPLPILAGVEVSINGSHVKVKGPLGELEFTFNDVVAIKKDDNNIVFAVNEETKFAKAMSGTARAIINNMITGVSKGFEKRLTILGVGYRVAVNGSKLNLTLGYSHPVEYDIPAGIDIKAPTQTELLIKGANRQLVGEVAAQIRSYRPVEPYKGKGVRYADEKVILKETKKK